MCIRERIILTDEIRTYAAHLCRLDEKAEIIKVDADNKNRTRITGCHTAERIKEVGRNKSSN